MFSSLGWKRSPFGIKEDDLSIECLFLLIFKPQNCIHKSKQKISNMKYNYEKFFLFEYWLPNYRGLIGLFLLLRNYYLIILVKWIVLNSFRNHSAICTLCGKLKFYDSFQWKTFFLFLSTWKVARVRMRVVVIKWRFYYFQVSTEIFAFHFTFKPVQNRRQNERQLKSNCQRVTILKFIEGFPAHLEGINRQLGLKPEAWNSTQLERFW